MPSFEPLSEAIKEIERLAKLVDEAVFKRQPVPEEPAPSSMT